MNKTNTIRIAVVSCLSLWLGLAMQQLENAEQVHASEVDAKRKVSESRYLGDRKEEDKQNVLPYRQFLFIKEEKKKQKP